MGRRTWLLAMLVLVLPPFGCSQDVQTVSPPNKLAPVVRVRLLESRDRVTLAATAPPVVRAGSDRPLTLNMPADVPIDVSLAAGGWRVGNRTLGTGELLVTPAADGTVAVDGQRYRGRFRLVPVGPGRFDVVNDVDVDAYLMGVVSKELLAGWHEEAYKAQAIVARTYALYEVRSGGGRSYWDLFPDQRSQVYGGMTAETPKSRAAVDATRGVVVVYGPEGNRKIFRTYFSSCCGGVTQSAVDAFGFEQQHIEPLSDQNVKTLCAASPRFSWGPVVVRKDELTRRFRLFAQRRSERPDDVWAAMRAMGTLTKVEVPPGGANRWGRPVRFIVTDVRGVRYSLSGEELRTAINTDGQPGTTVYSSFFKLINDVDSVRFVEGHGWGHGAGMCQWCAQSRALQGMRHEDIIAAAFQRSACAKAY